MFLKTLTCWVRKRKEIKKENGKLPKEANSNAKRILTMREILKRTSLEKLRKVESKPEAERETEKTMIT